MPQAQKFKRNASALLVVMAVLVSCVAAAITTTTTLEKRQREQDRFRSSVDILSRQEPFWGVSFRSATSDLASASSFDAASATAAPTALTTIIDTTTTTLLDVADSMAGSFLLPDSKDIHISHGIEPDCEIFFLDAKEEAVADATMTANAAEGGDLPKRPERFLITYASMSEERAHKHTGKKEVAWGPELLQGRDTIIRGPVLFLHANVGDNENDREGNDGNNKEGKHVVQFEVPYAKGTVIVVYTVYTTKGQEDAPIGQAVKETISIPPFTVKVSFVVRSWEFEPEPFGEEGEYERRLKATMILYSVDATGNSTLLPSSSPFDEGAEGDQANEDEIADNNALFSLGPDSPFSLRSRFLNVAEVDGSLRPVSIDTKLVSRHSAKIPGLPGRGIEVTMTFPHFNDILIYDPDFSVLLPGGQQEDGDDNNGDGANVEDDDKAADNAEDFCCESAGFYGLISALVLVAVAIVVVSMLVAVLVHRRKNQRFKEKYPLRSAGAVQIQIDSESSASSTPTSTMRGSSLASFRNLSDTAFAPA